MKETRNRLADHQALPFFKRALRRISGQYPDRYDRRELRRYEIGPWGRVKEDLSEAVFFSRKISVSAGDFAHQRVVADGKLSIWPLSKDPELVTTIDRRFESVEAAAKLWELQEGANQAEFDGVAFELEVAGTIFPDDIYQAHILFVSDGNPVGSIKLDQTAIDAMSEEQQDLVGRLAQNSLFASERQYYAAQD